LSHQDEPPLAFRAPPFSCDAHFHVFGPADRYPHGGVNESLRYAPPFAPLADYLAHAKALGGFERFVFVQPSAYGRDNSCMLDAMREVGIAHCRGVVDVDEDAPDALLAEMNKLGVRGVRINVSPVTPPAPGFSETMKPRIARLDARCAELGWMLDFLHPGWLTEELMPVFATLQSTFTIAHMGVFRAEVGPQQPGLRKLINLVRQGEGRAWVKLTGAYRMATLPALADAAPMARALIEAVPDRLIWGSDHPHLSFADKVGTVELFNFFGRWVPDEANRRRILVDNPQQLFKLGQ